jgi:DNA-binding transcriptional MocR family regulator
MENVLITAVLGKAGLSAKFLYNDGTEVIIEEPAYQGPFKLFRYTAHGNTVPHLN